jgi:hypothetical protein
LPGDKGPGEESGPKMCPLLTIALKTYTVCDGDGCAWWSARHNSCCVPVLTCGSGWLGAETNKC